MWGLTVGVRVVDVMEVGVTVDVMEVDVRGVDVMAVDVMAVGVRVGGQGGTVDVRAVARAVHRCAAGT